MGLRYAARFDGVTGSAIRDIFKLLTNPEIISFAGGNPANSALQSDVVSRLAQKVLAENGVGLLQYGQTEGYAPLRESAAEFFRHNGVDVKPEELLPVTGSQQALDLICKAMLDPGDAMLVESPTFLGALQTFKLYQAKLVPVDTDEDGVVPELLEEKIKACRPKLIYLIPTFQNPTGRTLSLERRKAIAKLLEKYEDVVLIEDDPYRDLRYAGEPLPAIKAFDTTGRVLYCNSFSKIISPGLRVAAIACTEPTLMRKLVIGKQSTDVHSPNLNQAIVDAYLREGILMDHIAKISASYGQQMAKMQEDLEAREYEASAGGGMVSVKVSGKKEVLSIEIKPEAVDPDDVEMLQDMVMAAVNEALRAATETTEREMSKLTGGLNMPGLF